MWGKAKGRKRARIDTLVGQQTEVQGDLHFQGGLHVDGTVKGSVVAAPGADAVLTLSREGAIEGEVRVPTVILDGRVSGDVHASDHVELATHARITGNVYYHLIEMAAGAEVNGKLVHRGSDAEDAADAADAGKREMARNPMPEPHT